LTAISAIIIALVYCIVEDIVQLVETPTFDRELIWCDFSGIPYFFGVAMFMFEGNTIAMEIYY
jgi:hypothetical protein